MSDELKTLIDRFRNYQMTRDELLEQEINFAYGNAHFENPRITREMVINSLRDAAIASTDTEICNS